MPLQSFDMIKSGISVAVRLLTSSSPDDDVDLLAAAFLSAAMEARSLRPMMARVASMSGFVITASASSHQNHVEPSLSYFLKARRSASRKKIDVDKRKKKQNFFLRKLESSLVLPNIDIYTRLRDTVLLHIFFRMWTTCVVYCILPGTFAQVWYAR